MARMLASSQKVWKIEPIEGADRIELAHVLGWQCVVKKGTFIAKAMKKLFGKRRICLQGELCGPGIQGNKYKFDSLRFFLFGAFDSDKQEYFTPTALSELAFRLVSYGGVTTSFAVVPNVYIKNQETFKVGEVGTEISDWLSLASSRSIYNEDTWNEGIVVRSLDNKPYGVRGMEGGRFSFKVISNDFLLQYGL